MVNLLRTRKHPEEWSGLPDDLIYNALNNGCYTFGSANDGALMPGLGVLYHSILPRTTADFRQGTLIRLSGLVESQEISMAALLPFILCETNLGSRAHCGRDVREVDCRARFIHSPQ